MRKVRVIIFEDEELIKNLLSTIMSGRGYEVLAFDRPVSCILYDGKTECINEKPCADIIITDHHMPGMTGLDMLLLQTRRGCKADRRNTALISGDPFGIDLQKVKEAGCSFFSKPIRLGEFLAWLDECEKGIDLSKPVGFIRKGNRHSAHIDISYADQGAKNVYRGVVMNYGVRGLCLKATAPLSVEQSIVIEEELPNGCTSASVRWVQPMEAGFYLAGLACTSPELSPA